MPWIIVHHVERSTKVEIREVCREGEPCRRRREQEGVMFCGHQARLCTCLCHRRNWIARGWRHKIRGLERAIITREKNPLYRVETGPEASLYVDDSRTWEGQDPLRDVSELPISTTLCCDDYIETESREPFILTMRRRNSAGRWAKRGKVSAAIFKSQEKRGGSESPILVGLALK
jgi:hypothetical protein